MEIIASGKRDLICEIQNASYSINFMCFIYGISESIHLINPTSLSCNLTRTLYARDTHTYISNRLILDYKLLFIAGILPQSAPIISCIKKDRM